PELKGIRCAPATKADKVSEAKSSPEKTADKDCNLSGDRLFLIDAVSAEPDFSNPVTVPDGFVEEALAVPSPKNKTLYIKLRDDPATVNTAVLPVLSPQP